MTRSTKSDPTPKPETAPASLLFEAIGTTWIIDIYKTLSTQTKDALQESINDLIEPFDKNYSRFRSDSLVSKMASQAGTYKLPTDAKAMLDLYQQLYKISDGAVTPLIGQVLSDAGYDASYSLQPKKLSSPPKWEDVLEYNFPKLTLRQPALLDFGALGKGYLVDLLADLLTLQGYESFCINAGGDIRYQRSGSRPLRVGLENPDDTSEAIGVATITNQSLCGSAGNRRAWGNFHHIMNPHTLSSPMSIKAAWATAQTTMLADAMTTALFFVLPQKLRKHYNFEYALLHSDSSLEHSQDFPAEFFTER